MDKALDANFLSKCVILRSMKLMRPQRLSILVDIGVAIDGMMHHNKFN